LTAEADVRVVGVKSGDSLRFTLVFERRPLNRKKYTFPGITLVITLGLALLFSVLLILLPLVFIRRDTPRIAG